MAEKRKNVRNTRPAGSGERTRKTGNGGSPKSRSSAKQSGARQGGAKSAGSTKQPTRSAQDKRAQAQRKRRMEEQRQRVAYENPAKSVIGSGKKNGYPGNKKGHGKRDNQISWTIGVVLGVIQAVASVVFMIALFVLDMLPVTK